MAGPRSGGVAPAPRSCRSTPLYCLGVGRSGCVDEAIGAVALAHVEQHVGGHRPPAPGRVGADAFPGQRHRLLDGGRIVVAGNSGQADQARQQRLEQGPGGQIVAGASTARGPEDGGRRVVVTSPLEQTVQIRQPAQHGVSDRQLPQRPAGAAKGRAGALGVQAHQRVGHGGPRRHIRARGASRPVFTPTDLLLSPNRIVPAAPSPRRSPPRRRPAASRGGAGRIGIPVIRADSGWSAHGTKGCAPAFTPRVHLAVPPTGTRCGHGHLFVHLSVPPTPVVRQRFPPTFTSSSPTHGHRSPKTVAVHLVVPRPSSRRQRRRRGER